MKQYSYDLAYNMLTKAVESEYSRHWKQIEANGALTEAKLERYLRIRNLKGTESDYVDSCYEDKKVFAKPYWSNASSNSIVKKLIEHADLSVRQEIERPGAKP